MRQARVQHRRDMGGIAFAIEQVILRDAGFIDESIQQIPPEAGGMIDGMPTYSSRWNISTSDHSMSGDATSMSRNSTWETPVAAIIRAWPVSSMALRMIAAAFPAAARLIA